MRMMELVQTCPLCGKESTITVDADRYKTWIEGRRLGLPSRTHSIQAIFPELSPGDREQILNGCHEACFDKAFGGDE